MSWFLWLVFEFLWMVWSNAEIIDYVPSVQRKLTVPELLKNYLIKDDFSDSVRIMENHMRSSFHIGGNRTLRIVVPVITAKQLSISLSPCYGELKWQLSWRPPSMEMLEVVQKYGGNSSLLVDTNMENLFENNISEKKADIFHKRKKRKVRPLGLGKRLYKTKPINGNFSAKLREKPIVRYLFNEELPLADLDISSGEGINPWIFSRAEVYPGLYILTIASAVPSKLYAIVSGEVFMEEEHRGSLKAFSKRDSVNDHALILSWRDRQPLTYDKSCLAISRKKLYSSLCSATSARSSLFKKPDDFTLIVGCIYGSEYNIPSTARGKYYITVWEENSLIPYARAVILPRPKRQLPRLKSGEMVSFTLAAGGYIEATYMIRKKSKKLHISAVSCTGGVRVVIYQGKRRVAGVRGKETLHLVVKNPPKGRITIRVYPDSPKVDYYRVKLVASHSARKLPIPRLPNDVRVKAKVNNCTSAHATWRKAKGGASYCVAVRQHPSGQSPEIRTPLQCGWEQTLEHSNYFEFVECMGPQPQRRQLFFLTNLMSNVSYLVYIFVKHPITGRMLALFPAMITTPLCI